MPAGTADAVRSANDTWDVIMRPCASCRAIGAIWARSASRAPPRRRSSRAPASRRSPHRGASPAVSSIGGLPGPGATALGGNAQLLP